MKMFIIGYDHEAFEVDSTKGYVVYSPKTKTYYEYVGDNIS